MTHDSHAATLPLAPRVLKNLIVGCDINQKSLGDASGVAKPTINRVLNSEYFPKKKDFKPRIESFIKSDLTAMRWLKANEYKLEDIWLRETNPVPKSSRNARSNDRLSKSLKNFHAVGNVRPGDPNLIIQKMEVEMLRADTMKHFKLKKHPFIDDIKTDGDIFSSDEHRYIEAAMMDAALNTGFLAIIGEVGSGKSIIRRKIIQMLNKEQNTVVIYPQIIDRRRLSVASICDAIVMDFCDDKVKRGLEQKARHVHKLLQTNTKGGRKAVLIIEEAQDLSVDILKQLKRFHEYEDGFQKMLGIILIGQTELKDMFDESRHPDMREVIRRVTTAEIKGLNGNVHKYLKLKFYRAGGDIDKIFTVDAIKELTKRLTRKEGRKTISMAYPLTVNGYATMAMNEAVELDEKKVTAEIINSIS